MNPVEVAAEVAGRPDADSARVVPRETDRKTGRMLDALECLLNRTVLRARAMEPVDQWPKTTR
jgi:hypothetical protein